MTTKPKAMTLRCSLRVKHLVDRMKFMTVAMRQAVMGKRSGCSKK